MQGFGNNPGNQFGGQPNQFAQGGQASQFGQMGGAMQMPQAGQQGGMGQFPQMGTQQNTLGQMGQTGQQNPSAQFGAFGQAGQTGAFGQTGQTGVFGQAGQTGAFGQTGQTGAFGQAGQAGAFGQAGQAGAFGQPGQLGQTGQLGQPGAFGAGGQLGQPGAFGVGGQLGQTGGQVGQMGQAGQSTLGWGQQPQTMGGLGMGQLGQRSQPSVVEQELQNELQRFYSQINFQDPGNKFKVMLYNMIMQGYPIAQFQQPRPQLNPETQQLQAVDESLFNEAQRKNPNPNQLYPYQINSCKQLLDRIKNGRSINEILGSQLSQDEEKLREIEVSLSSQTAERFRSLREAQGSLFGKLCQIRMKFEQILSSQKLLKRDTAAEMKIRSQLEQLERRCDLKKKLSKLANIDIPSRGNMQIHQNQIEDITQVLLQQRVGLESLKNIVKQDLQKMEKLEKGFASINQK